MRKAAQRRGMRRMKEEGEERRKTHLPVVFETSSWLVADATGRIDTVRAGDAAAGN